MIAVLDVSCPDCNARAGTPCWVALTAASGSSMRRCHRARKRRAETTNQMNTAALALFGTWPMEEEVEFLARLGEGDERASATKLLSLIEATGYEGELFTT